MVIRSIKHEFNVAHYTISRVKKLYFIEKYHQNVYSIYIIKLRMTEYPIQTVQNCYKNIIYNL